MKKVKWLLGTLLAATLVTGSLQGTVFAAQQQNNAASDAAKIFDARVKELEKQYGVLKEGASEFKADPKNFYTSSESPIDEKNDCGILFTDVRDYDKDGAQELLSLRRVRGSVVVKSEEMDLETEKYDYIFEMYEASGGKCNLAASKTVSVFDVLNWSIYGKNISVFIHETDGAVDICTETFINQQDHPSDTALVLFRYDGKAFSAGDGIRFGDWYQEHGVRCMKPVSEEALGYLSDLFPSDEGCWEDVVSADSTTDEAYLKARDGGMKALGFIDVKSRDEIMEASDPDEVYQTIDESIVDEPGMEAIELNEADTDARQAKMIGISALECYKPEKGTMTRLVFVSEYVKIEMSDDGMVQIERNVSKEKKTADKAAEAPAKSSK